MRALLDTHTFLWWITDDHRLSDLVREIMGNMESELYLSAASGWEMAIKAGIGKLSLPGDLDPFDRLIIAQANGKADKQPLSFPVCFP